MYIPFYVVILIILYSLFWIGGFFITLFQMADEQISSEVTAKRFNIFLIMGFIELLAASSIIFIK